MSVESFDESRVATKLLILGGGAWYNEATGEGGLQPSSEIRVDYAAQYLFNHEEQIMADPDAVITPSGGWQASSGQSPPPEPFREGSLMENRLKVQQVPAAELIRKEVHSGSTLLNIINSLGLGKKGKKHRVIEPASLSYEQPLGVFTDPSHMPRALYFLRRLGIPPDYVLPITVGPGKTSLHEVPSMLFYRVGLYGVNGANEILKRDEKVLRPAIRGAALIKSALRSALPLQTGVPSGILGQSQAM